MQNESYRDRWAVSQSMWKKFKFCSPAKWKRLYIDKETDDVKDNESFTLGSLIDTLLFTPEDLDTRFYIGDEANLPSEAITSIIKNYYEKLVAHNQQQQLLVLELPGEPDLLEVDMEHFEALIASADSYVSKDKDGNEKVGWNTGWKSETRIKTLIEKGSEYFESLKKANGRKIISQKMNFEAIALRDLLHKHAAVKDYFVANENNLLLFQLEIFSTYQLVTGQELPIKGALDIVRFNHIDRTVQIIDFKSSYSAFDFLQSIRKFGYCDQLSFYDFLLRQWLVEYCQGKYCEYRVIAPINIVIDVYENVPYIYEYEWSDLALSREGNEQFLFDLYQTNDHGQRVKPGWKDILENIGYHYFSNNWSGPRELIETGKIKVKMN